VKPSQGSLANFAGEITARLENANPGSPEAALFLAESLSAAADKIKNEFGQEKANEFMSRILKATDAGLTEKKLTYAISDFFGPLMAESRNNSDLMEKLEALQDFLNKGLDLTLDARPLADMAADGEQPGVSYALNNFFGTKAHISEDGGEAEVKGFNSRFERVYMSVGAGSANPYENGFLVRHNLGAIKDISPETVNLVSSFLREQIGDTALAEFLDNESARDFLGAVTISIAVVAREYGRQAAEEYVGFLNDQVAPAISSASGDWYLKGWQLDGNSRPERGRPGTDIWASGGGGSDQSAAPGPGESPEKGWTTLDVDMGELYAAYKKAATEIPVPDGDNLQNPLGNLVDIQA
jgi:hypothetical protein